MLNRVHPPGGETLAVADPVHVVDHRLADVPRTQEIGVQGVHRAVLRHRHGGGQQRLAGHQATEDTALPVGLAEPPEQIVLQRLQAEPLHQFTD